MKHLNFLDKLIFLINSLGATLLLLSYALPYVPPKAFSFLAVLSLAVPFLILINIIFFIYWIIKVKKQFLLSGLILALGFGHITSLYNFSSPNQNNSENTLSVMSYNVRLLNLYNWIEDDVIPEKILKFINKTAPDILSVQEYNSEIAQKMTYPFVFNSGSSTKSELAIFSKYSLLNTGIIKFPNSANSAIFADVLVQKDTLRIYNIHLQSSGINPTVKHLNSEISDQLFKRISKTFEAQHYQADLVVNHMKSSPYKTILSGDFNNTTHSYVYRLLKSDFNDAFDVAGDGFGRTFSFDFFPLRIDFILADKSLKIVDFHTYDIHYSDHFPISTTLELE